MYALLLLSRVNAQIESQLLDCQSAFRRNRGLSDAAFTLRTLMSKCREHKQPLYMAFVDLTKAYDSIPRHALWCVLRAYGVHDKLVQLLIDLHTGTQAAIKLAGRVGEWFDISTGVRQGCVIAPLLFNVFFDCVVRQAQAAMPEGCGVQLSYHANGELFQRSTGAGSCLFTLSTLLYADDMVLMSCCQEELECMLRIVDDICNKMGMRINASKTELLALAPSSTGPPPQGVQLSGGVANYVSSFKYLGGIVDTTATCDAEVCARISKAKGRFAQMQRLWGMKNMSVSVKMRCYNAYVLPVIMFASETWALTKQQTERLECVHSSCLRQLLHVRLSDRHRLVNIRKQCGTVSLAEHLAAARLRWLGHVVRMDEGRIPQVALFSSLHGVTKRPRGRPPVRWQDCVHSDLQRLGLPHQMDDLRGYCLMRGAWRSMVYRVTHPEAVGAPLRFSRSSSHYRQQQSLMRQQRLQQMYPVSSEPFMIAGVGWQCPCGRIHPTRECTDAVVQLRAISD